MLSPRHAGVSLWRGLKVVLMPWRRHFWKHSFSVNFLSFCTKFWSQVLQEPENWKIYYYFANFWQHVGKCDFCSVKIKKNAKKSISAGNSIPELTHAAKELQLAQRNYKNGFKKIRFVEFVHYHMAIFYRVVRNLVDFSLVTKLTKHVSKVRETVKKVRKTRRNDCETFFMTSDSQKMISRFLDSYFCTNFQISQPGSYPDQAIKIRHILSKKPSKMAIFLDSCSLTKSLQNQF